MEKFLNPSKILKKLRLRENIIAADFGSGSGGWVLPLAKEITDGKVYAVDILEEPLSALKGRTRLEKISNIETVQADVEKSSRLKAGSCDLVLMTNLLFQCRDKKLVFDEARRILKPGGKILIVDWKDDSPLGPAGGRVSLNDAKEYAGAAGFKVKTEFDAGLYSWGLVLVR